MRPIDADALRDKIINKKHEIAKTQLSIDTFNYVIREIRRQPTVYSDIESAPTIDAVPVVRCKDCRYWGDSDGFIQRKDGKRYGRCTFHNYFVNEKHIGWCPTEDDYCSCFERK